MNLLSKSSSLEESIIKMETILENMDLPITFSTEKHPLQNCYSVNLTFDDAPQHIFSNGKGIVSLASTASALGEFIERLQTNNFFTEFSLPNRKYYPDEKLFLFDDDFLDENLRSFYDPSDELEAEDFIDYNSDYIDKIVSLPFKNLSNNTISYIPLNILNNLYGSNGLATGNTPQEAQVQALSEIFERYVKIQIIKNGYSLPKFPDNLLKSYEKLYNDIQELRALGYIVEVLDASLGGKFPVTAISLINPKNSTLFVSFGAHPILEVSLERTMTELMQGRNLDDMDSFQAPTFDMSIVSDNFNLESHFIDSNGKIGFSFLNAKNDFEYSNWKYTGKNTSDEYQFLLDITKKLNKDIYIREYDYLGFYSCQVIIPSISEIYPVEDMIYNNTNKGKFVRDMIVNFKEYDPQDIIDNMEGLDNNLNIEKHIGVIFKTNFTLHELRIQLYLMLGEYEEAIGLLEILNHPLAHLLAQLCRIYEEQLEWAEYEEALYNVFTKEKVNQAVAIFNGEVDFIDTSFHGDYKNILNLYDKLYEKKIKP
jgi:ribosomal protein S12 methylthiotransferase accessory factor